MVSPDAAAQTKAEFLVLLFYDTFCFLGDYFFLPFSPGIPVRNNGLAASRLFLPGDLNGFAFLFIFDPCWFLWFFYFFGMSTLWCW